MQRVSKDFTFSNGTTIAVQEANWSMSMRRQTLVELATEESKNSDNKTFDYFNTQIYPHLSACSVGDVPDAHAALNLPDNDLDNWFNAVKEVNPQWFVKHEDKTKEVEFRDGGKLTVVSAFRPSTLIRVFKMELDNGTPKENETPQETTLRILYYPKMAGCSVGQVPTLEEAFEMPEVELNKWYEANVEVNPHLFISLEQLASMNQVNADEAQKKMRKRRRKSSGS